MYMNDWQVLSAYDTEYWHPGLTCKLLPDRGMVRMIMEPKTEATLDTEALALVSSITEYCVTVCCHNMHIHKIDTVRSCAL